MHFDTKKLTRCALIAAIYVALTMLSNALNLAYGPIQLRFSEAMTVLPFLMPEASWGLFIGCVLSNILSPYGPLDMIVGSAATLLAALLTARCRNKWTAALPPCSATPSSSARSSRGRKQASATASRPRSSITPSPSASAKLSPAMSSASPSSA